MQKNILVIENNEKHLNDAKAEARVRKDMVLVDFATTYETAEKLINSKDYDRIISDIFFPFDDKKQEGSPDGWNDLASHKCFLLLKEFGITTHGAQNVTEAASLWIDGFEMHPTGVIVVEMALELKIPIVLCMDIHRRILSAEPVKKFAEHKGVEVTDSCEAEYR